MSGYVKCENLALLAIPSAANSAPNSSKPPPAPAGLSAWKCRASFTQAARAVATGACAGILPAAAQVEFAPGQVVMHELPFLTDYSRPLALAWNPRTDTRAPIVQRA